MALNFQPPSWLKPTEGPDIPRTIDEIYNTYLRAKQMQGQQEVQSSELDLRKLQIEQAKREIAAKNFQEQMQWGGPVGQITPEQIAQARMPAQSAGFTQGPVTPGNVNPFQSQIGMEQGQQQEHPIVGKLRGMFEKQNAAELMDQELRGLGIRKARAEATRAERLAADPGESGGAFFTDPESGMKFRRTMKGESLPLPGQAIGPDGKVVFTSGQKEEGKQLPPASVLTVNEGAAVSRLLPEIGKTIEENQDLFGPVKGRVGGSNPYNTRAQTVDAKIRAASQAFGRFMEGGVLRKEDEEKYRKMFPGLSDKKDVAVGKLSVVSAQLNQKYASDKKALGDSGYDVRGLQDLPVKGSAPNDGVVTRKLKSGETVRVRSLGNGKWERVK